MSMMANATPIVTTVTKTTNKEKASDAAPKVNIQDFCEEHYEDILPIIMEKTRRDKRKEVQTRLNLGENSKRTRRERENSLNSRAENSPARFYPKRESESSSSRGSESSTSNGGHWKLKIKRRKLADEDDMSEPWTCEDVDPFTPRIRNFKSSRKTRMPNNVKTYDGTGGPEDHLKIFQAAAQPREGRGSSRFTPIIKTPKEILVTEARKFKPPPPMVTPVEKRSSNKFYDFHNDKGHNTDECMQLKKQIEEFVRGDKLSHLIKEIKQGRDQIKSGKKEAPTKDKSLAIYMIRQWQRTTKQKLTQSFAYGSEITFPPLADSDGTEGPLVIEAEIGGHMIHRIYIDGGSSTEILYEHCFNQLRLEIRSQMVPARTSLTGFSGETIWPLG
ncbi:hypothetical protein Tco_0801491 [Tanacetum coccineum]|uniref:Reverse transcriptase domain-containing protein n=1 Tax=Tanacetum coccineum TaxID=301880 RepID=A0ABQ5A0F9_9ASTR